jgi:opacity protein-like surface antigen
VITNKHYNLINLKYNIMKKLTLCFLLIISVLSMSNAQFTKVGGGLALSSGFPFHNMPWPENKSGLLGLSFKGIYKVNVPLNISPSFTILFPHITNDPTGKTVVSSMMFDINGHYVFHSLEKFEFYGLAGLDILLAKKKNTPTGSSSDTESDNALGLNLGVGANMKLTDQFDLYGEAKYVFNNKYNQFMVNAGILINLDWMKKHENDSK